MKHYLFYPSKSSNLQDYERFDPELNQASTEFKQWLRSQNILAYGDIHLLEDQLKWLLHSATGQAILCNLSITDALYQYEHKVFDTGLT